MKAELTKGCVPLAFPDYAGIKKQVNKTKRREYGNVANNNNNNKTAEEETAHVTKSKVKGETKRERKQRR